MLCKCVELAMGIAGPSRKRADVAEIGTDAKPWEVVDAGWSPWADSGRNSGIRESPSPGTDPKDVIRPVAHAEAGPLKIRFWRGSWYLLRSSNRCKTCRHPWMRQVSFRQCFSQQNPAKSFPTIVSVQ